MHIVASDFLYITTNDQLQEFVNTIGDSSYITVDTEFLREHSYWPRLCLIQIASANQAAIIDPLTKIDLSCLFDLMINPNIIKVFHSARQDIEIFFHLSGKIPSPIFDTQLAAMVCGYGDCVSYENLVASIISSGLDKGSRVTDWSQRPLTARQLAYAISDVTFLRTIYAVLIEKITASKRDGWIKEQMDILQDPATYINEPQDAWRRIKVRQRGRRFLCHLQALAAWRELEAKRLNIPRGRVLRDDVIVELALHPPRSYKDLANLRNAPKSMNEASTMDLLKETQQISELPDDKLPILISHDNIMSGDGAVVELLKVLLTAVSEEHGVASRLIATNNDLESIAVGKDCRSLNGWRYQIFGEQAIRLRDGHLALTIKGRHIRCLPLKETT